MKNLLGRLAHEEAAQDLIEYSLLAAFISLIAVASISNIGNVVTGWYAGYDATIRTIPSGS